MGKRSVWSKRRRDPDLAPLRGPAPGPQGVPGAREGGPAGRPKGEPLGALKGEHRDLPTVDLRVARQEGRKRRRVPGPGAVLVPATAAEKNRLHYLFFSATHNCIS